MHDPNHVRRYPYRRVTTYEEENGLPDSAHLVKTVPTRVVQYDPSAPTAEVYRQAVRVMLTDPAIERRMNYIAASTMVSVFGGYLAGRAVRSREFTFVVDVILFLLFTTMAGLVVGLMVGLGILPSQTLTILLFLFVGLLIAGAAVILANLIFRDSRAYSERSRTVYRDPNESVDLVTQDGQTYYRRVVR